MYRNIGLLTLLLISAALPAGAEPVSTATKVLSPEEHLARTLAYVYENDPKLAAEREALKALDQRTDIAYSGFRPNAYGTLEYGRRGSEINDTGTVYGQTRTRSLVAEQPLFSGFGTSAQYHAAKERVAAGRAKLLLVEEQALLAAIGAYLDLAQAARALEMNEQHVTNIRTQREGAEKRFHAGDGTRTDIAQAESRLAEAESGLVNAQADWSKASVAFERATGLAAETVDFPIVPKILPASLEEAKEQSQNAPEMAISRKETDAGKEDVSVAKSSLWPTLSLRGSFSDENGTTVVGSSTVSEKRLTLNLRVPLYQGGAEYARVRESKNTHARLGQEQRDTARSVVERASKLWYDYKAAQELILTSTRAADAAAQAVNGTMAEQREGLRTLMDVLDTQNELLAQQLNEVKAQKNARVSAYQLLAATGQLTAQRLGLPTQAYDPVLHYEDNATRWAGF